MSLKKTHLMLALGVLVMTGCLVTSYMNEFIFMDRLLAASGIISCILFVKAVGNS